VSLIRVGVHVGSSKESSRKKGRQKLEAANRDTSVEEFARKRTKKAGQRTCSF
jgi:hypothetical protein